MDLRQLVIDKWYKSFLLRKENFPKTPSPAGGVSNTVIDVSPAREFPVSFQLWNEMTVRVVPEVDFDTDFAEKRIQKG